MKPKLLNSQGRQPNQTNRPNQTESNLAGRSIDKLMMEGNPKLPSRLPSVIQEKLDSRHKLKENRCPSIYNCNLAEESVVKNLAEESVFINLVEKSVVKNPDEKSVVKNLAEKFVVKNLAEKSVFINLAEKSVFKKESNRGMPSIRLER